MRVGSEAVCLPVLSHPGPTGVDPGLRRDDVRWMESPRSPFNVMPAVMAEPCFAWTAGPHASFSPCNASGEVTDA
jgi:hypothetical protein